MPHRFCAAVIQIAVLSTFVVLPDTGSAQGPAAGLPSLPSWIQVNRPFQVEAVVDDPSQQALQQAGIEILTEEGRRAVTSYSSSYDRFYFSGLTGQLACQARTLAVLENDYVKLDCVYSYGDASPGRTRIVWNLTFKPALAGRDVTIKFGARTTVSIFASGTIKAVTSGEPVCNAGTAYSVPCSAGTRPSVTLNGSKSSDPLGGTLSYAWTTTCSGGSVTNGSTANPILAFDSPVRASELCEARLFLSNSAGVSTSCSARVTVQACSGGCDGRGGALDQCGICAGDGRSCLDCNGVPFGSAQIDRCGICGGQNECIECPNGGAKDVCGVCGGDGISCLDCKQVPFGTARVDRCGICGGDGLSCLRCTENTKVKTLLPTLLSVDLLGLLRKQNKKLLSLTAFHSEKSRIKRAADARLARALKAQSRIDQLVRQLPSPFRSCNSNSICKTDDYTPVWKEIQGRFQAIRSSLNAALAAISKVGGNAGPGKRQSKLLLARKTKALAEMPKGHTTCG